jgi:hypothetical protein
MAKKKVEIRHIGDVLALCNKNISAGLREDLGYKRYKQLGVSERFKDEKPYRICERCLKIIENKENRWL